MSPLAPDGRKVSSGRCLLCIKAHLSEFHTNQFPALISPDSGVCRADVETELSCASLLLMEKGGMSLCASPFRQSSWCYFYRQ